ncbi:GIY-YIG nuclease family protein [Paraburkholderia aspalathi]|uniref:GIY-YIG nuclease family protein n=1 Tax=Paraburkholderia aspalathi TaxID=1324617 RepID=UPI0038BC00B1
MNTDTGIYSITSPSGSCYIGSAISITKRWNVHRQELRRGTHHCRPLQFAANKYGLDSLVFERIVCCAVTELLLIEQREIDRRGAAGVNLYNIARVAGSQQGLRRTAESRERMAAARRGKTIPQSVREKIGRVHIGNKYCLGKVRPPEIRAKIAGSLAGRPKSPDHAKNAAAAQIGRRHTEDSLVKMRAAKIGRALDAEHRAKIGAAHRGKATGRNASGYPGVALCKRTGKWRGKIAINRKSYCCGRHATPAEAYAAILARRIEIEGV